VDLIYRFDPYQPLIAKRPADFETALAALVDGNQRLVDRVAQMQRSFMDGGANGEAIIIPRDFFALGLPLFTEEALDQTPFAMVLGCSDARVPVESVFDQNFNDLFVVRMAGNVLGVDGIGSFQYALRNLGRTIKTTLVLGHTSCGAVTAAVDVYLRPGEHSEIAFSHSLRSLVDRILIAVRGAASALDHLFGHEIHRHPNYRAALIDASVFLNAAITAFDVQREVAGAHYRTVEVVYGVCNLRNMLVSANPAAQVGDTPQLRAAPQDSSEFSDLATEIVTAVASTGVLC
jgi:carbonic anhydrase